MADTRLKVLYMEDEPDIRAFTKLMLEAIGPFDVSAFESARAAIDSSASVAPDVLLIDMMLPEMSGVEALRVLRAMPDTARTPAMFITGRSRPEDAAAVRDAGAAGLICKPFEPTELAAKLATLCAQSTASAKS